MRKCDDCRYRNEPEYNKPCVVYREDCPLYQKEGDGMRMIDADVLKDKLGVWWDKQDEIFAEMIDECPTINPQEPKWIPVSERLPELREDEDDTFRSDNVLVWLSHEFDAENPMICYYFKYDEWEGFVPTALSKDWQDIHSGLVYPVAWMPLPEPYKAESEE